MYCPLAASQNGLLLSLVHSLPLSRSTPLPIPKYECIARPKGRLLLPPALAPAHAALTTRHECDNLMEDERENKAGTKEIAAPTCSIGYGGGGLDFLVNNQVQRREGIRDAAAKFVWAALWRQRRWRRRGGRSLCFIIKAAKSLPLFAMRCAEPMDGCRHWLLSPSLPSLLYPPRGPRGVPRRHRKAFLKSRYDFLTCFVANYFKFVCFAITRTKYTLFKSYRE